ncbi:MAG: hypothetical protein LAO78_03735 [Acidobacteriia bacterium]|nr:hypothetical protein [Terriglobia bacterium]
MSTLGQDRSRALAEDDRTDAKALIGRQFWAAPVIFTAGYFVIVWFVLDLDFLVEVTCLLLIGGLAAAAWVNCVRQYRKFALDMAGGLVQIVEGAPERVYMTRFGRCYMKISGRKLRVANEYYNELREANNVRIEFLPESRIAIRVNIARGLGI